MEFFIPYLVKEPILEIDKNCHPKQLKIDSSICEGKFNRDVFTGKLRNSPVKTIIHAVKFSFDVNVLEIHLNEFNDVVDYFVIVESILGHRDQTRKPLLWEFVKNQARFRKFEKKIVHFVLDDSDLSSKLPESDIFGYERLEEQLRYLLLFNVFSYIQVYNLDKI